MPHFPLWSRRLLCIFFSRSSLFIPAWKSHLKKQKHTVSHRASTTCTHTDCTVCLCVCRYKCMVTVILIFSFILSPLLPCQEGVSLCIYKSLFLSASTALHHSPSLSVSPIHPLFPRPFCVTLFFSLPLSLLQCVLPLSINSHHVAQLYYSVKGNADKTVFSCRRKWPLVVDDGCAVATSHAETHITI